MVYPAEVNISSISLFNKRSTKQSRDIIRKVIFKKGSWSHFFYSTNHCAFTIITRNWKHGYQFQKEDGWQVGLHWLLSHDLNYEMGGGGMVGLFVECMREKVRHESSISRKCGGGWCLLLKLHECYSWS